MPSADPHAPAPAIRPGAKISTVLVEDFAPLRELLTTWLQEAAGVACTGAFSDVETAIPSLQRLKPDVAFLDINLPGLSGIDCVRTLKPLLPGTQFVMLTVYQDSSYIFDALAAGATGYLLKSTTREALIAAVREVYAGGSPMSGVIARKVVQSMHAREAPTSPADELSRRENEVLALLTEGYLYKEIADKMGIGVGTVNTFIRRIYEKLHVHSRAQAVARCTPQSLLLRRE